jgi:hypothetical protein
MIKGLFFMDENYYITNIETAEWEHKQAEKGNSERELAPLAGGLVSMSDDFDETPDCFKEYM